MTTRDPRSADDPRSGTPGEGGLEPTESLNLAADEAAELANGTHDGQATSIESPRGKTTPPAAPARQPSRPSSRPASRRRSEAPDKELGEVLGSYRLVELLGKGGMGYVYRAEHTRLGREVALKLLRGDYASRRDAVSRFFQEARTVNRVRHRNIVDVTDFVELDDGTTYIIMELLTGPSLGAWSKQRPPLPRALAVLVQICDGLDAAHQVGVVHRDLKPDNVIVVPGDGGGELVKLLDFGVAKLLNREDEDVGFETAAGSVIGTPAYMSPEQAGGMAVDGRSDIYSLGALMYDMFCGQPMFRGRAFGEFVRKHLTEAPVPPRQTPGGAQLDPALEAVILRCLEKDPAQRYASILELRAALLGLLGDAAPYLPGLSGSMAVLSARGTPLPVAAPARRARRSRWRIAAAAGLAAVVGAAVWLAMRPPPAVVSAVPPSPRPAPPSAEPIVPATAAHAAPAVAAAAEVRFESQPSGGVFADGSATELCRTPCSVRIDSSDGGATDRRGFVIRQAGYREAPITVDLTASARAFRVALEPAPRGHASKPAKPNKPAKLKKPAPKPRLPDDAHEPAPSTDKPADTKPTAIDPTDTIDPFRAPQ
jgi:serine/threonine protein kinase